MGSIPLALLTAVGVQTACQLFKVFFYSARDRRLSFRYFVSAGGIPSSHTAFVTALSVAIALRNGVNSDLFAVSAVFSAIVIYDAFRLRGHVQKHAEALNRLVIRPAGEELLSEMVGHNLTEIFWGLAAGGGLSALVTLLTR